MGVRPETLGHTSSPAINQIKSEPADVNLLQFSDGYSDVQTNDLIYSSGHQNQQKYYHGRG